MGWLQRHVESDMHRVAASTRDYAIGAAKEYFARPIAAGAEEEVVYPSAAAKLRALSEAILRPGVPQDNVPPFAFPGWGWARPKGNRASRKTPRVVAFLEALFDEGERTIKNKKGQEKKARKVTGAEGERRMRENNFEAHEILTAPQITAHFSQIASRRKRQATVELSRRDRVRSAAGIAQALGSAQE